MNLDLPFTQLQQLSTHSQHLVSSIFLPTSHSILLTLDYSEMNPRYHITLSIIISGYVSKKKTTVPLPYLKMLQ